MSRTTFPRTLSTAALLALALLAAACGSSSSGSSSTATSSGAGRHLRTVRVLLDWTPNTNHAGMYLAKAEGWYRDAGLDVQLIEPGKDDGLQVVASGKVDFAVSASEQLVPARAAGVPVVSIAAIIQHNTSSLLALRSSGITGLKDLAGRTYGSFGGTFEKALIDQLVSCGGVDPKTVRFREVGDADYRVGLTRKQYDFVWVFDGWDVIRMRDIDGLDVTRIPFIDHTDCIPDWYTPIIVTNEAHISSARDHAMVQAFMSATARGYREAMAHPTVSADAMRAAVPEADRDLLSRSADFLATRYTDDPTRWGVQDPAVWNRFVGFLEAKGLVKPGFDTAAAFTDQFLQPAASKVTGPTS